MKLLIILVMLFSQSLYAKSMRVMTFNTTCSVCEKGKFDSFSKRKYWIVDTIKRANPDLISMQEVLFPHQLHWIKKKLKDYHVTYYRKFYFLRHTDSALFTRKDRFRINRYGGFWLGPRGGWFSFGWKPRLPRRIEWQKLEDLDTGHEFYFIGSHFDNKTKNKDNSAKMLLKRFKGTELPVLFAADTNLKPSKEGYGILTSFFDDTYDLSPKITLVRNSDTSENDSCNLEKGKTFPECRVDHIFVSKKDQWIVSNWAVDQFKYGKKQRFTSDHRALFVDLELK